MAYIITAGSSVAAISVTRHSASDALATVRSFEKTGYQSITVKIAFGETISVPELEKAATHAE